MSTIPNMILFKHEGVLLDFVLNGKGDMMGASHPVIIEHYDRELSVSSIVFLSYDPKTKTSEEVCFFSIKDDKKSMAEVSISEVFTAGKLQEIVTALYHSILSNSNADVRVEQ